MAFFEDMLTQTIVYWALDKPDGRGGYLFDSPVEITGRWEDRQEKFVDANGEEVISKSIIFLNQDVTINGWLYLGEFSDLSSGELADPGEIEGPAGIIRQVKKTSSIDGTEFLREAILF